MMKWILLAVQLLSSHRTLLQSQAFMERAKGAAEKSKKMAFFSFTMLLFLIYFIAGSILMAINLGAQADSGKGIVWSGTMWAASGLIGFGFLILSVGAIVLKFPTDEDEEKRPAPTQQSLAVLLDQLAVTFVSSLVKNLSEKVETTMRDHQTKTPHPSQEETTGGKSN